MARLGETLGWGDNPFYQAFDSNRRALVSGFSGIGADPRNPAAGFSRGFAQGMEADDAYATQQKAEAERQRSMNQTLEYMRSKGFDDLVAGVEGGGLDMGTAWAEALKRSAPGYGQADPVKPIEVNGQLVDPVTGRVIGDYRDPNSGLGDAPAGYRNNPDGTMTYITGGPADPSTPAKTTEATRRNQQLASVIQPELATVEANWEELSQGGNQAANAAPFGAGYGLTSPGYQQATSALNTIAQSYLYSVSGAAAPAEEVRKLVDSVTPRPFESPQSIADKKERVRQMAAAVVQAGSGSAQTQQPAGNVTSSGLQWSLEP